MMTYAINLRTNRMRLVNFIVSLVILWCATAAWCCKDHSNCDENNKCHQHKCEKMTCSDTIAGKKTPSCGKDFKCKKGECVPKTCDDADGPKCPADKTSCVTGMCKAPCFGANSTPCAAGFVCTNPKPFMACPASSVGQQCLNSYCEASNCSNGGTPCADNEECCKGKCRGIRCYGKKHKCPSGRKCVRDKKHDQHEHHHQKDKHKHMHKHDHYGMCFLKTCADAGGPICPIDKLSCVNGACVTQCAGEGSKPCGDGLVCTNGNTYNACVPNMPCPNSSCQPLHCGNGGKPCADNEECYKEKCRVVKCKNNKCHSDRKCVNGDCYLKTCADAGGPICKGSDLCRFDTVNKVGKCVSGTEKTCADPNGSRCADNQRCQINPDLSGTCVFKTCAEPGGPLCVGTTVCRIDSKTKVGSCVDGLVKTCADGGGTVCPANQKCQTNADLSGACVSK